jgi:hypothetical protein
MFFPLQIGPQAVILVSNVTFNHKENMEHKDLILLGPSDLELMFHLFSIWLEGQTDLKKGLPFG